MNEAEKIVREVVTRYFGVSDDQFDTVKRDLVPIEDAVREAIAAARPFFCKCASQEFPEGRPIAGSAR